MYCLKVFINFTRTTLFTTMFTMIMLVYSLKCMCIPSFTLIGGELHTSLYPYHNVWPEAVYSCFTRTNNVIYMLISEL